MENCSAHWLAYPSQSDWQGCAARGGVSWQLMNERTKRKEHMKKTKISLPKLILTVLTLLLAMTSFTWAQGNGVFVVSPTTLDFGNMETFVTKTLPITVTNISQQQVQVNIPIPVARFTRVTPSSLTLNPGEQKSFSASFRATGVVSPFTDTLTIQAGTASTVVTIKGSSFEAPRFPFGINPTGNAGQVIGSVTGDPQVQSISCDVDPNRGGTNGCGNTFKLGAQLTIQTSAANFEGWRNGTGSAAVCTGKAPCTFTINASSSITAAFAPLPAPQPQPRPTSFNVSVSRLGPGKGEVEVSGLGGPTISTLGLNNGLSVTGTYGNGSPVTYRVTPAPNSKVRSVIVRSNSSNAQACNGRTQCTFTIRGIVNIEVGFDKR